MRGTEFLILRHGQTLADLAKHKVFAPADDPLTDTGIQQARAVAQWIATHRPPQRIISSPLIRAKTTANEIARRLGMAVETDGALAERDNGALAGLTEDQARAEGLLPPEGYHRTAFLRNPLQPSQSRRQEWRSGRHCQDPKARYLDSISAACRI